MTASANGLLAATLARLEKPPRTASLIITVWGDAVVPRGGSLWLGTLQALLDRFGCREGQVRTAMSRLTEEGWLARTRQGRLSFYRLGPRGEASFAAASRRIYAPPRSGWDGAFRLALSAGPGIAKDGMTKDVMAQELTARGFVPLAPGFLLGTAGAPGDLPADATVLLATPRSSAEALVVAARAFPGLGAIADGYRRFITAFAPLAEVTIPGEEALPLRLLLVHEWRRIALRDPGLPLALLPPDWPGTAAHALAGALYRRLLPGAEAWLDRHGRAEDGALPPARDIADRFAP